VATTALGPLERFRAQPVSEATLPTGLTLAVVHLPGDRFAIVAGTCPHAAGPLAQGDLIDGMLVCPVHGWAFDPTTGATPMHPYVRIACFESLVQDGQLFIVIPDPVSVPLPCGEHGQGPPVQAGHP